MLIVLSSLTTTSRASNYGDTTVQSTSGKVMIIFFHNYDYFSRELPFQYAHEVEALDFVRRSLFRARTIQNLPINIHPPVTPDVPWKSPPVTKLSLEDDCGLSDKDSSKGAPSVDRCYRVEVVGEFTHGNILALILSLPQLSVRKREVEVSDLQALRAEMAKRMQKFEKTIQDFDPIWSPDGTRLNYTVWRDGHVWLEILDPVSHRIQALEPPRGYLAVRPLWSPDSRRLAYASLTELKLFDRQTGSTKTIQMSNRMCCESLLYFPRGESRLLFAYDTNAMAGYQVFAYDLVKQTVTRLAIDAPRPKWARSARSSLEWKAHASRREARSSTGQYIALIRRVNGLRRVVVRPQQ